MRRDGCAPGDHEELVQLARTLTAALQATDGTAARLAADAAGAEASARRQLRACADEAIVKVGQI